jgi:autotransporter-associated beta strand protein
VQWTAGGGFTAGTVEVIVRLNNGTGTLAWGSPGFVPSGQPLVLGLYASPATSGPSLDFQNGLDLNGATQTVAANGISSSLVLVRVSGPVVNTGAAGAGLTKTGTGTLELTGTNTYDGPTTATGGVLRAAAGTGLPAAGNLTLDGAVFEASGTATFSRSVGSAPGQVQWGPNGGGLSAYNGTLTVRLNNGTGTLAWGSAGFIPAGKPLVVGAYTDTTQNPAASAGVLDVQNGIDLAGSFRTIDARFLPPSTVGTTVGGLVRFSGPIGNSSGTAGVVITGSSLSPVVEFAGANTYTGQTTTFGPVLRGNPGQGLPAASNVTVNGGGLELTGPVTFSRTLGTGAGQVQVLSGSLGAYNGVAAIQLNGGTGTLTWGVSSSSFLPNLASTFALTVRSAAGFAGQTVLDFQNGLNLNGTTRTIQVLDYTTTSGNLARISGPITNSTGTAGLTVQGSGTSAGQNGTLDLTGANTYTGTTTVSQQATLRAADGVGLPAASNLTLNNGVYESPGTATFTRSLGNTAGKVQWASGADGGFAAGAGTLTVRLNNGAGTLTWGSTILFVGTNANLVFGSQTAAGVVDFQNGLDLGTGVVRTVGLRGGATARLSGVVSNANALQVTGPGTLELTAANTFTLGVGITTGATVLVKNATGSGTGTGTISVGAGGVFGGTGTAAGAVSAASGSGSVPPGVVRAGDATGAGTLTLGNGLSFGGGVLGVRVADGNTPSSTPGGSTVGTLPNPTSNNFLNITGGTFTFGPSNPTVEIDGTGTAFQAGQPYSYRVGQAAGQNLSGLSVTTQSRFTAVGFAASSFALTGDAGGGIYVSFTAAAVPEPGLMLVWASFGVVAVCRSRRRRFGS